MARREFKDIEFEWDGKTYALRTDQSIMKAIAIAERHLTLHELVTYQHERSTLPLMALSEAWAAVLKYAGCDITTAAVYKRLAGLKGGDQVGPVHTAFVAMMMLMMPDDPEAVIKNVAATGNGARPTEAATTGDTSLLPPPTKPPSPGESNPMSSGDSIQ